MSEQLTITITAKDGASQVFRVVGQSAQQMGQALDKAGTAGQGLETLSQRVSRLDGELTTAGQAFTGFGAGITAAIGISVNSFADLEAAMANVGSIAPQMNLGEVTNQIRELAVELGTSPVGLAEGLYDLISSGISAADAMDVLKVSATAAKAGLTDTATASRAITAVLNAYSLEAEEAGNVSDLLFNIVNEGVITFEGLANNLQNVIPLASSLGVGLEEVGAAFKELTLQGFSAATAETGIAGFMRAAINPTEELTDAVREYGFASVEALVQAEGLSGLLRVIEETAGGSSQAMLELLGTSEATTAVLALLKDGADAFAESSSDMFLSMQDGALTAAVAARQMDTVAGSMDRLQAASSVLSGVIGETFAGIASTGIDFATAGISRLTDGIQALPGPLQTAAAAMTGLAGGAALLAGGLLLMAPRIVETRAALQALGGMRGIFGSLAGIVSPLGLALTAVAGGALLVYENMQRATEGARNYADSVEALTKTIEELKLAGETGRATMLGSLQAQVDSTVGMIDVISDKADEANLSIADFLNFDNVDPTTFSIILADDFNRAIGLADDANIRIGEALSNPNIDATAYSAEVQRLLDTITVTAEGSNVDEVMQAILDIDLTKFRDGVGEVKTELQSIAELNLDTLLGSIEQLSAGEKTLATLAERTSDFATTLDDLRIEGDLRIASQLQELDQLFQENANSSEAYLAAQDRIFERVADGSVNFDSVQSAVAGLNAEYARTGDQAAYEAGLIALSQNLAEHRNEIALTAEEIQKLREEWIASAQAIAGWDNALSQLNLTGLTGELGLFAEEGIRSGQVLDNTFRILVGNVQNIGSTVQQVTDWMAGFVAVNEEGWYVIDQLAAQGRITWDEATAAVEAYNVTAERNYDIQQNLLAIQAMQAPFIADQVAATQVWVQELANMDAAQQRVALSFMDMQTVQQAQEIITLGNSEAFAQMGESGTAAFEQVIQGALQTNPLLFNVLETMGIVNGTPMNFEVDYSALEGAGSALDQLTTQVGYLVDTLREIHGLPPIAIETNVAGVAQAQAEVEAVLNTVRNADGTDAYMVMTVNTETGELEQTGEIIDSVLSADGKTANVTIETTGGEIVQGVIDMATGEITMTVNVDLQLAGGGSLAGGGLTNLAATLGIPETIETSVTVTTEGVEEIDTVASAIDSLPDSASVSVTVDVAGWEEIGSLFDTIRALDATATTITVTVDADTSELDSALAVLGIGDGGGGGAAGFDAPSVTINIDAVDNASAIISEINGSLGALSGDTVFVTVEGNDNASDDIATVSGSLGALNGDVATVTITGIDNASDDISTVNGALGALNGDVAFVTINAIDNASGVIGGVSSALSALDGRVATSYVDTVNRTFTQVMGRPPGVMHGGIPEYAMGGVTARMGEAGAELLRFAGGGTAWAPYDALYTVPPMTYVSPAPASRGQGPEMRGGDTYEVHIHGNVYGIDDLAGALEGAIWQRRRGHGGMRT